MTRKNNYQQRVYAVVKKVPAGLVATYGQVARLAGRCTARMAGYAMAACPEDQGIPWHRVLNARGEISLRASGEPSLEQRLLLESEGVLFDRRDRVDLKRFGWRP